MCLLGARDLALQAAAMSLGRARRPSWFFNSFFITKLLKDNPPYCYANVRRWSHRAGDIFQLDKVRIVTERGTGNGSVSVPACAVLKNLTRRFVPPLALVPRSSSL